MNPLAVGLVAVAFLGALGLLGLATAALLRVQPPRSAPESGTKLQELAAEVAELKLAVAGLPSLWESEADRMEEAAERAKREHSRARAARSAAERARAREEDDDTDDDDDGEGGDVLALDDARSARQGVQPVRAHVEADSGEDLTKRAIAAGWSPFL